MTAPRILSFGMALVVWSATSGGPVLAMESPFVDGPPPILRLQDALALALIGHPELEQFSWDARVFEARKLQAGKIPNPEIDIRLWRLAERQGRTDVQRRRVIVSEELELGGKRSRRVELAELDREIAWRDYEVKRLEVAGDVTVRFVSVLGSQVRVDSLVEFVDFYERMHSAVSRLVDLGSMRQVDLYHVIRSRGLARVELQRAEAELATARYRLAVSWGADSPEFERAVGDFERVKPLPPLETVLERARLSPAMEGWNARLERQQAAIKLAKSGRVPNLTLGAGVRWEQSAVYGPDYLVDLEIGIPIFDRKQGAILESRYMLEREHAAKEVAEVASHEQIAEIYFTLSASAQRSVTMGGEVVPAARATFEAYKLAFEKTADNLDDLFDSRRDLARAEVEYADALIDYHQALALLESLIGDELPLTN